MTLASADVLCIRELTPDDWVEVAAIYRDGIRRGMATFEIEVPPQEQWFTEHSIRVVAEVDERVIGWAALAPVSSRWAYRGVAESSVYVARDHHGRGIGRAVMEDLIARSERAGIWTIQTSIFPENAASLKLHHRVGFRVVGLRKSIGKRDGLWRDTVLMERRSEVVV
jgi:L-amino acid N-acyltransferase YncA